MSDTSKPASASSRLKIGLIGAGKVGVPLTAALQSVGHEIVGVNARSENSQDRAEALLPHAKQASPEEFIPESDLVIIAVPDDQLSDVVEKLADQKLFRPGQLVLHTSGRYGTSVLLPARNLGATPLALHPIMTFTGTSLDLERLKNTPFGITADVTMLPIAQALVYEIGGQPHIIAEGDKTIYHAAIAHAANHLMTLTAQSSQILQDIGITNPAEILGPVLHASVDNALNKGESALTGPVARGDSDTVAMHAQALLEYDKDIAANYRDLALATAKRAKNSQTIDEQQYKKLLQVFGDHFFEIDPEYNP